MKKGFMKKSAAAMMAMSVGMTAMPAAPISAEEITETYRYADLNYDGAIDVLDLVCMKRGYQNPDSLTAVQKAICDLNADGTFDADDITVLQEYLVNRIAEFPSGQIYSKTFKTPDPYNGQKTLTSGRWVEKLDRGTYAVNAGGSVFVSWRLLAQDEQDIGFNLYRRTNGTTVKLNSSPITGGTNFTDKTADLTQDNTYYVTTVYNGVETPTDGDFTLKAGSSVWTKGNNGAAQIIPIKEGGTIHFVWVGDFNGDGAYDYLVDRCTDDHQKLEAYLNDGTYLWTLDLGVNSENKNNITPGASTLDVGMWDGATVYDLDLDGSAEILVRIADGVTFGDGKTFSNNSGGNGQAIAVLDGMTGKLEASVNLPQDYMSVGPMACMMEVGYLDGVNPALVCWLKNRNSDKSFNSLMVAYGYAGGTEFKQLWKYDAKSMGGAEAHQFRVEDVNYDGKDEVLHMGYALNGDGTLRYQVKDVVHGDRWHVTAFSNAQNGKEMWGYGVQQRNPNTLLEYIYNASTGKLIWTNYGGDGTVDIGRGDIGDVDPTHEGMEVWSFQGMYDMNGNKISDTNAYPSLKLYWDGDLLSESYNDSKIEKWHYDTKSVERLATTWKITGCSSSDRGAPMFYGDILGDWREEIICTGSDYASLVIISTTMPTDYRLNTLSQDPAYRNDMTSKGYVQSNMLSYYLGDGMDDPGQPDVRYIGEVALDENAVYAIRNVNSGRCMDVSKSGRADGTNVQQYGTVPGKANNTWKIKPAGNGYYYIVSELSTGENCYMTVADGANTNGANVEISSFRGDDSQKFKLKANPGGSVMIMTKCSRESKCVEIINAETGAGANVQQWVPTGSTCQWWKFEKQ
ncbi:Ricin-type beta-trefoil lectin domain-like [Ruminococcus sp. YE71]|uniref:rhamnogalacturonan lyase family protein n=1 Tax=unclassified Ruminococcus TaxID=2608920 RepID=UPI000886A992|nr:MULTISPECIES: RICIN domain-containing protein [unclassified Ruminococcus]SDA22971.1 Ricin-type beta-trefoil lectin domain-like [Ruminococcus sp. YE78]SFW39046.1 Ricin-type beta-trefoil lectin domain-like [Ruminococcus sp. YE71]